MLFHHNKKAMIMAWIIRIALLLFAAIIIVGVWNMFFSKAEGEIAEQICRGFNAARTKTEIKKAGVTINLLPQTCKRLEKTIPSKDYRNEDVMLEISKDLVSKCWWQWLEGIKDDMFGERWLFSKERCFICYTFDIKKDIGPFDASELKFFLDNAQYKVDDLSDMCNVNGGGYCRIKKETKDSCEDDEKEIPSTKCPKIEVDDEIKEQVCCNKNIKCENKGGKCLDECGPNQRAYENEEWSCKGSGHDKCCIKEDTFLSYTEYVQRYMGEGRIIVAVDEFVPLKETYAVTYVSKTSLNFWKGFIVGWGIKYVTDAIFGGEEGINAVVISKLSDVEDRCAIQADTSGI